MTARRATQPVREPVARLPECYRLCELTCRTGLGRCCERPDVLALREREAFPAPHQAQTPTVA